MRRWVVMAAVLLLAMGGATRRPSSWMGAGPAERPESNNRPVARSLARTGKSARADAPTASWPRWQDFA